MRAALIEAAEQLIRQEGYPAVTSRNLADKVSLKRQIIHYYFQSMDDLFIAVIRHGAEKMRPRLEAVFASEEPLRALWELNRDPGIATLAMEMNALANRRPAVRAEVSRFAEEFRDLQTQALAQYLERRGVVPTIRPIVATVLLTSLSQVLTLESAIDVNSGHAETFEYVEECLRAFAEGHRSSLIPSAGPAPDRAAAAGAAAQTA